MHLAISDNKCAGTRSRCPPEAQTRKFDRMCEWLESDSVLLSFSELFEKMVAKLGGHKQV